MDNFKISITRPDKIKKEEIVEEVKDKDGKPASKPVTPAEGQ